MITYFVIKQEVRTKVVEVLRCCHSKSELNSLFGTRFVDLSNIPNDGPTMIDNRAVYDDHRTYQIFVLPVQVPTTI